MDVTYHKQMKVHEKLFLKEKRYEKKQKMLRKISDEYKTFEEVFDNRTLKIIYKIMNKGLFEKIHGIVSAGKEARVYMAEDKDGKYIALKISLTSVADFKKGRTKYVVGDRRFNNQRRKTRDIVNTWCTKEYKNLIRAYNQGISVPKPMFFNGNILAMEFIGDEQPALTLREIKEVSYDQFERIIEQIKNLYVKTKLVHADLSEYNIFYYNQNIIIFDMAQSVLTSHPLAETLLERDIKNIITFFQKRKIKVDKLETVLEEIRN